MKTRIAFMYCLLLAGAFCLGAAKQADQPKTGGKKEWSPKNAVAAFTAALSRSEYDRAFRNRLTASPSSAKQAVSDEGQIVIPKEVVIVFHEDKFNEKYHVFYLPDFKEGQRHETQEYAKYFECCYSVW